MPRKVYAESPGCRSERAFTLIELLVVLTIIAVLTVVVFINFRTFSQDQVLNKASGQLKTILREAQSNATSGLKCAGVGGAPWAVRFLSDKVKLDLICGPSGAAQKTLTLDNTEISSIQCSSTSSTCPPTGSTFGLPLTVSFSPLSGNVTFLEGDSCVANASNLMIALRNLKNNNNKCLTVSKGGAIDVK